MTTRVAFDVTPLEGGVAPAAWQSQFRGASGVVRLRRCARVSARKSHLNSTTSAPAPPSAGRA